MRSSLTDHVIRSNDYLIKPSAHVGTGRLSNPLRNAEPLTFLSCFGEIKARYDTEVGNFLAMRNMIFEFHFEL